jgi:hypothetical protein
VGDGAAGDGIVPSAAFGSRPGGDARPVAQVRQLPSAAQFQGSGDGHRFGFTHSTEALQLVYRTAAQFVQVMVGRSQDALGKRHGVFAGQATAQQNGDELGIGKGQLAF